jgi:hypothetical protein
MAMIWHVMVGVVPAQRNLLCRFNDSHRIVSMNDQKTDESNGKKDRTIMRRCSRFDRRSGVTE